MLVLSRKTNESLEFPELGVVIRVMSLKNRKVRLGIEAPKRIKIRRTELGSETPGANDAKSYSRRLDSHRLGHELDRLESQISALAELASPSHRELVGAVVADSQKQLEKINRLLVLVDDVSHSEDNVWSTASKPTKTCVRQTSADFTIGETNQDRSARIKYRAISGKAVWFPFRDDERQRAIA